jgi:cytochrome c biogenesis protein CcmG/thiol:disulfide interchange protein DsbE
LRTQSFRVLRALILLGLVGAAGCYDRSRPTHIGQAAKDFSLQDSDRKISLNQFHGQIVILNFWASWCEPCVEELPSLMNLQDRVRKNGVVVLGISIDVDDAAYHRFLNQRQVNFLTVRDPEQKVAAMYGTSGWPETYIIDRHGVMRRKFIGPVDWTSPEVMRFLGDI